MDELELKLALDVVLKAKTKHPDADRIEWNGDFVQATYNIYPEGMETEPF